MSATAPLLLRGTDRVALLAAAKDEYSGSAEPPVEVPLLTAEMARKVAVLAHTVPFGESRSIVIGLDGATDAAQNQLLKTLEEPFPAVRFVLYATQAPLVTVVSRCRTRIVAAQSAPPEDREEADKQVMAALSAAKAGNLRAVDAALRGWGEPQHASLSRVVFAAACGLDPVLTPERGRLAVALLAGSAGAHPRLAGRLVLSEVGG